MYCLRKLLLISVYCFFVLALNAQSSGVIQFELETFMPKGEVSMGGMKYELFFSKDRSREVYNDKQRFSIANYADREGYACMTDLSVMVKIGALENLNILYTNETKQIAGYLCRKAVATGETFSAEFYITNQIKANYTPAALMGWVEGVVLEYKEYGAMATSHIVASQIELTAVSDTLFELPQLRTVTKVELVQLLNKR